MKLYTLGVALTSDKIALIRKTKPDWQAGSFNFVGGKVEKGEDPVDCIRREFHEETGVLIQNGWKYVGRMYRPDDFTCFVYTITHPDVANVRTTTEEEVVLIDQKEFEISDWHMISNLKTIFQFVKSFDFATKGATLNIIYPT